MDCCIHLGGVSRRGSPSLYSKLMQTRPHIVRTRQQGPTIPRLTLRGHLCGLAPLWDQPCIWALRGNEILTRYESRVDSWTPSVDGILWRWGSSGLKSEMRTSVYNPPIRAPIVWSRALVVPCISWLTSVPISPDQGPRVTDYGCIWLR